MALLPQSCRRMQRRPAVLVRGIDIGLMGQQQLDRGLILVHDRLQEQRRAPEDPTIRVGAALQQRFEGWGIRRAS